MSVTEKEQLLVYISSFLYTFHYSSLFSLSRLGREKSATLTAVPAAVVVLCRVTQLRCPVVT